MGLATVASGVLTRRALLGRAMLLAVLGAVSSETGRATDAPPGSQGWRPWLLNAIDELRPLDPGPPSSEERSELLELQGKRTAATAVTVAAWGDRAAVLPWSDLALDLIRLHRPGPVRAARALALVHTAMFDAVIATRDAKLAYRRMAPWIVDHQLIPLGRLEPFDESSFPSEHAAIATAASLVLAALFPKEPPDGLDALAKEAAESRLWAGACYRSDITAGQALGREVAERAIARGTDDGADMAWDGERPGFDGTWQPTPPGMVQQPLDPMAGTWRPWVLPSGDVYRPSAFPAWGTQAWQAELGGVQEAVAGRTPEQEVAVRRWAGGPGTPTPAGLWIEIARDQIIQDGFDTAGAARVLALTSVAMADAMICCWDAKYAYWTARPITADPALNVLIPTPPFPSYTSGHATVSAAAATVLSHLLPKSKAELDDLAREATASRLWAGIHFPLDCEMGALGGGMVGRLLVQRAKLDEGN